MWTSYDMCSVNLKYPRSDYLSNTRLGINPTDDLRTHSKPSASWRCRGFPACMQVICAVDYVWNTQYVWNPCMDLCRLCPQVFSHDFWKSLTNIQNYLFFLSRFFFFLMCSEKSGCMVTTCVILWLPARKQAHFLKSAYCYLGFLFLLYFVYETI